MEDIFEDILAGSDQPYPTLTPPPSRPIPSTTKYHDDSQSESASDSGGDSDSSIDAPQIRRKDSIMAPEQVSEKLDKKGEQDAEDQEETAAQRVFGTYELLENILLNFTTSTFKEECGIRENLNGLKTVLLAQGVNKTFEHVIKRSTKLQEKLFFKYKADNRAYSDPFACNPFLTHPASELDFKEFLEEWGLSGGIVVMSVRETSRVELLSLPTSYSGCLKPGAQRPSYESWRRMLVLQGEPLDVQLRIESHAPLSCAWRCGPLVAGSKTTMGEIWDKICANREWTLQ